MPSPVRIPLDALERMLEKGKTLKEIAAYYGVSYTAAYLAKRRLQSGVKPRGVSAIDSKIALMPHDPGKRVDTIDRIKQIETGLDEDMERLLELFEKAVSINEKGSIIKLRGDILGNHRKLLLTKLEFLKGMADLQAIPQLVSEILDVLEEVESGSREKILHRLESVLGPAVTIITGAAGAVSATLPADGAEIVSRGCGPRDDRRFGTGDVSEDSSGGEGE